MTLYTMHAGVVGSQRQRQITSIEVEKMAELLGAAPYVLDGIMDVPHTQGCSRVGSQLHEPDCSLPGHDMLTKV